MSVWECTGKPIVLAHRGGPGKHPENSIDAFEAMVDKGFTYIETDTHATADGELVLIHDPLLDRTTDGSGPISMKTWDEVKTVHDQSGRRPLLLREALERFPALDFNVDIKADSAVAPIIELVKSGGYHDRVLLASFSEKRLRAVRKALPGVATSVGAAAVSALVLARHAPARMRRHLLSQVPGTAQGVACAQLPEVFRGVRILDERLVEVTHSLGLAVHVWTVNEAMDMARLLDIGVDGLITDRPTLAREVIETRHGREAV